MSAKASDTHHQKAIFGEPFLILAERPWTATGIQLKAGQRYRIEATADTNYRDFFIPCDADGPRGILGWLFDRFVRNPGRLNPFRLGKKHGSTKHLRVLEDCTSEKRRASFLTLIACQSQDDGVGSAIVIGKSREFNASRDAELYLFANDWPGGPDKIGPFRFTDPATGKRPTYSNNKGSLTVIVTHLPSEPR